MTSTQIRPSDVGLVFLGGALGATVRVGFATWFPTQPGRFPLTTFSENVLGAFLLAAVLTGLAARANARPRVQLLLGAGMLGAFTTYSTFAGELGQLLRDGATATAFGYSAASLSVGVLAAGLVVATGRATGPRPHGDSSGESR